MTASIGAVAWVALEPGVVQVQTLFQRVNERYLAPDVLTDDQLTAVSELRKRLTDVINPYPVEESGKRVAEGDAKYPGWQHSCNRIGTMVIRYGPRAGSPAEDGAQ